MRRALVAFALTSSLLTPLSTPLWDFLSSFFTPSTAKAGAGWDPNGLTHSAPPVHTKEGAGWDPDGLTTNSAPPAHTDAGAEWDPNG